MIKTHRALAQASAQDIADLLVTIGSVLRPVISETTKHAVLLDAAAIDARRLLAAELVDAYGLEIEIKADWCRTHPGLAALLDAEPNEAARTPSYSAGQLLSSTDPEPPAGTVVLDPHHRHWHREDIDSDEDARPEVRWFGDDDATSWTKLAGNYGPVRVIAVGSK